MLTLVASKPPVNVGEPSLIHVQDNCFGSVFYVRPRGCDIYACFVLFTILTYEKRNISASNNIHRCFKFLVATYGINLDHLLEVTLRDWRKICPTISIKKYWSLLNRVIVPKVLRES